MTVKVTNAGRRAGDEVVQLYLHDRVASVTRPVKELRGFSRVRLKAGESKRVEFKLGPADLGFYDRDMKRVVEPGKFDVMVGASSADVPSERRLKWRRSSSGRLRLVPETILSARRFSGPGRPEGPPRRARGCPGAGRSWFSGNKYPIEWATHNATQLER